MPDIDPIEEEIEQQPIFNKGDIVIHTNPITGIETEWIVDYSNIDLKKRNYFLTDNLSLSYFNDEIIDDTDNNTNNFIRISQLLKSGTINSILITDLTNFKLKENESIDSDDESIDSTNP